MCLTAKLNGKLTLGENTADNGGLRIAYMALLDVLAQEGKSINDKIDGYTEEQRYFLGFAQVWCQNQTEQSARQSAMVDPHSPGRWRVNGTVQNFDQFGKAFGCQRASRCTPNIPAESGNHLHPFEAAASTSNRGFGGSNARPTYVAPLPVPLLNSCFTR